MKRSEINKIMEEALCLFREYRIALPPFVLWSPEEWTKKGEEVQEIKDNLLGWDITDFGSGDYSKKGLLMITLRNGNQINQEKYPKPYAEKIMVVKEKQVTPLHYHWHMIEDIINRGGGNLMVQLYNATEDNKLADKDVTVVRDGVRCVVPAGSILRLVPGESVTLTQKMYHSFWGEEGTGTLIVGEVSKTADPNIENCFYEPTGRFPQIEEDTEPLYLLCTEYPDTPLLSQPQLVMRANLEELDEKEDLQLPDGYTLRSYREDGTDTDERAWNHIIDECFHNPIINCRDMMLNDPEYRPERMFFICYDGEPVATASAWFDANFGKDSGMVHYVGALPGHSGKKLGLLVSKAAMQKMKQEGRSWAYLTTDDHRIPAIKTYLKLGFEPVMSHESHSRRWAKIFKTLNSK